MRQLKRPDANLLNAQIMIAQALRRQAESTDAADLRRAKYIEAADYLASAALSNPPVLLLLADTYERAGTSAKRCHSR